MIDTVQHYLCTNHLPAMPADDSTHHEPPQESIAPVKPEPVAKPDAPLKVGDWVEWSGIGGDLNPLQKRVAFPAEIDSIDCDGHFVVHGTFFAPHRLRRVPPPSEQVEIEEEWDAVDSTAMPNAEIDAIAAEQDRIAELTTERDELLKKLETVSVNYDLAQSGWHSDHERMVQMREQLADVTRERDELRHQLETWLEIDKGIREIFSYEQDEMIDLTTFVAQDVGELRHQLATVQAEAAAMRSIFDKRVAHGCHQSGGITPGPISYVRFVSFGDALACDNLVEEFIQGTAGRELLDELRRKDERIKQLEEQLDTAKRYWSQETRDLARLDRKCRTAKRDLIKARAKLDSRRWKRVAAELSLRLDGCDLSAVGHSDVSIGTQDTSDEKGGE